MLQHLGQMSQDIKLKQLLRPLSPLEDLFGSFHVDEADYNYEWIPVRQITVVKVSQDDPLQEVFRDLSGVYYATTRMPHLQFVNRQTLTF